MASKGFGGILAVGHDAESAIRQVLSRQVNDTASQLASRAVRHLESPRELFFEIELKANGNAEVVARPALQGDAHDGPHQVEPPQAAVFLAGRASTVAVVVTTFDMATGLFHGGIIDGDGDYGIWRGQRGATSDHPSPELVTSLVQGATQEGIIAGKVFDAGCATQPQIGGDGLSARGQGPARGQVGETLLRWGRQAPLK